jgi:3-hydroxybutyryl-CoA dehydrogenase
MVRTHVERAVVAGAGVMGHSIAQVYAQGGIDVSLIDTSQEQLDRDMRRIRINLETLSEHGRIPAAEIPSILGKIHAGTDLAGACEASDIAVEAVSEVPEIKNRVFTCMEACLPHDAIIASNTSGLDIFASTEFKHPERILVHHWFTPPHIVPLVEVAPGPKTSAQAVDFSAALLVRLGKKPVVMKEFVRSFIVNRIQGYIAMAFYEIIEKGWATPADIDLAVKASLGVRMPIVGVVQNQDFNGLDLALDVQKSYGVVYKCVEERVNRGELGVKSGKGFFDYGGRSEEEIVKKRDRLFLAQLDYLESLGAFDPV